MHACINKSENMALIDSEELKNEDDNLDLNDPVKTKMNEIMKRISKLPISMQQQIKGNTVSKLTSNTDKMPAGKDIKLYIKDKVSFRTENYIASIQPSKDSSLKNEKFDTIICLSTSKYIHLNFGDQGIAALFLKVYH